MADEENTGALGDTSCSDAAGMCNDATYGSYIQAECPLTCGTCPPGPPSPPWPGCPAP